MTFKNKKTKTTSIIAITFFAALMLVPAGMSTNVFATTPTFTDSDFSSGWIKTGTAMVATGRQAIFTDMPRNAEHFIEKSIGSTLSDSEWILDFKINVGDMDNSGGVWIGIASDDDYMGESDNDFVGVNWTDWSTGDPRMRLAVYDG